MKCKLGDYIRIKHGFAFKGEYITAENNGVVLVTPGNFEIGGGFKEDKCKFFNGDYPKEYVLSPYDLIVTMTDLSKQGDTLGYSALVPKTNRVYLHNQRIGLVDVYNPKADKMFIYWLMRTQKYQKTIVATSSGSTVKHTSPSRIYDVEVDLPPHEAELIRSAFVRNPADFRVLTTDFERLTKLQHYSLPTRLLDVTQNPLVALYFACQSNQEVKETENGPELSQPTDGIVSYKRDYCKGYDDLEVRTLSYLANREIYGDFTLEQLLSELQERYIYTQKTADECRKGNYKSLISIIQSNCFVISNLNNERLIRQSGAFLLCGQCNITLNQSDPGKSVIQKASGSVVSEFEEGVFRIPADQKEAILEELDFYNINEGALFPELEHQMTYIKKLQSNKVAASV